jgi:uncharacterized membrane protein YgcG
MGGMQTQFTSGIQMKLALNSNKIKLAYRVINGAALWPGRIINNMKIIKRDVKVRWLVYLFVCLFVPTHLMSHFFATRFIMVDYEYILRRRRRRGGEGGGGGGGEGGGGGGEGGEKAGPLFHRVLQQRSPHEG